MFVKLEVTDSLENAKNNSSQNRLSNHNHWLENEEN